MSRFDEFSLEELRVIIQTMSGYEYWKINNGRHILNVIMLELEDAIKKKTTTVTEGIS